jgi:hypothetical protein
MPHRLAFVQKIVRLELTQSQDEQGFRWKADNNPMIGQPMTGA